MRRPGLVAAITAQLACGGRDGGGDVSAAVPIEPTALAITHITVIDPLRGPQPDTTIVVDGQRIVAVGPAATTAVPAGAAVHDGSGMFAMPGLWDAHVHLSQVGPESFAFFIANGVTGVRDMGSDLADITRWRQARQQGERVPRIVTSGPKLVGAGEPLPDRMVVQTPEQARQAVDTLAAQGADFIKVHNGLPRTTYDAIAGEARARGLAFAGHAQDEITPLVAAAAGQRSIEHARGMLRCSPDTWGKIEAEPQPWCAQSLCAAGDSAEQILPTLTRARTWVTPTLTSWRGMLADDAHAAERSAIAGLDLAWDGLRQHWARMTGAPPSPLCRELIGELPALVAAADRAGVPLLAGTDTGDPLVMPGFAMHDELALMVAAGVPPLHALRSATLGPAEALDIDDEFGSITPGKFADIVLLTADPLADIANTRSIAAVIADGRWLGAAELRTLVPAVPPAKATPAG
jgi:imidazolonepropionase-like amidohydrolase